MDNKMIIRRLWERYNAHDAEGVKAALDQAFVWHNPLQPNKLGGRDEIVQSTIQGFEGFHDIHWTLHDLIAEGDRVVVRLTFGGTHTGLLLGLPPTGKKGETTGTLIYRLDEGRIVELWEECDYLGMLQQLGLSGLPS